MRVLLRRRGDGVGDWLFMLACIKHYARDPRVEFYVDFEVPARENVESPLPPIIRELYEQSDVSWYIHEHAPEDYDVVIPHVVYKRGDKRTYVESMLAQIITATGIDTPYRPELFPRFVYPEIGRLPWAAVGRPDPKYIALVSAGKRTTAFKDWSRGATDEVGAKLAAVANVDIAHIGRSGDPRLSCSHWRFFDCSLDTVAGLLAGARLFIGLENGMSVLASWLGTPTIVLYQGGGAQSARDRAARWCGPAAAKIIHPAVADVLVEARKVLEC